MKDIFYIIALAAISIAMLVLYIDYREVSKDVLRLQVYHTFLNGEHPY